jgi:hypothetical protein
MEGKKLHDDLDFGKHVIPMMLEAGEAPVLPSLCL